MTDRLRFWSKDKFHSYLLINLRKALRRMVTTDVFRRVQLVAHAHHHILEATTFASTYTSVTTQRRATL